VDGYPLAAVKVRRCHSSEEELRECSSYNTQLHCKLRFAYADS
jgi:hypothetical protein